jgi:hypothetical protein
MWDNSDYQPGSFTFFLAAGPSRIRNIWNFVGPGFLFLPPRGPRRRPLAAVVFFAADFLFFADFFLAAMVISLLILST